MRRVTLSILAAACSATVLCAVSAATGAQAATSGAAYPAQPIRFLVPNPPGGASDALARILAQTLTESFGQQVIVDNRAGGGGMIATEIAARATPDGYTMLLGFNGNLAFNPAIQRVPYDPIKDFAPAGLVATSQYMVVSHPSAPRALKEFVAYAKERPGQLNYSTAGSGSPSHLGAELLKQATGMNLVHVPYKGGAPAATAVIAGEAHLLVASIPATLPQVKAGKLNALGVTGPTRAGIAPDIPTIAELGYAGFEVTAWYGIVFPARTPASPVQRMNAELLKALRLPDTVEQMNRQGLDASGSSPAAFMAHLEREIPKWAKVVKEAGIRGE
jgi:tripartite-type tricarboxylate transporter receptor subunit TctC